MACYCTIDSSCNDGSFGSCDRIGTTTGDNVQHNGDIVIRDSCKGVKACQVISFRLFGTDVTEVVDSSISITDQSCISR